MAKPDSLQPARIAAKIDQVKQDYSNAISNLLKETNKARLKGRGKVVEAPLIEGNSLRWTLTWKEQQKISFELSILVNIEDDGHQADVGRVWVHRRASTPIDFEGHTPTTRMRRLARLDIDEIRQAIELEWA
jgi:hypothetical protein